MKLKHALLFGLYVISIIPSRAQNQKSESYQFIDSLYSIGAESYTPLLTKEFRIPIETLREANEGILIVQIKMNQEGKVSARFMTRIDRYVEAKFTEYLKNYTNLWTFNGQPYEVYQIVSISTSTHWSSNLAGEVAGFPSFFNPPFAPHVLLTSLRTMMSAKNIKVNKKASDPPSASNYMQAKTEWDKKKSEMSKRADSFSSPHIPKETTIEEYEMRVAKYEKHLAKNKIKKAHSAISEIIKFNPFDLDLLLKRVNLEEQLGIKEYQKYDIPWIVALRKMKARGQID